MIYDWPFPPLLITQVDRIRKKEESSCRIDENAHNYPESVRRIDEYRFGLIDLFEEIEQAENDDQDIFHGDGQWVDGRILCSDKFKEGKGQEKGWGDQYDVFEYSLSQVEVNEGGEKEVFKNGEQA